MTHLANHFAAVSQTPHLTYSDMQDICAGIDAQLQEDAYPAWGRRTHIEAFNDVRSIPLGYWPALIRDDIQEPGAAGYHTDKNGQPLIFVQHDKNNPDNTSAILSHEAVETIPDPFGSRLITVNHHEYGAIQILCEICDPPEDESFSYRKNGIKVSDFIFPQWYGKDPGEEERYSFTGSCKHPLQLLPGGYFSFVQNGIWKQALWLSGDVPEVRILGMPDPTKMLREWIDGDTSKYKATFA